MVGKHHRFSEIEKLNFLLNHLSEGSPAKNAVANYTLEAGNYEIVLSILKERFANETKIRSAHFQALQNLKPISNIDVGLL